MRSTTSISIAASYSRISTSINSSTHLVAVEDIEVWGTLHRA